MAGNPVCAGVCLEPAARGFFCGCAVANRQPPPIMKDHYTGSAHALRDALRHAIERGSACSLATLHQSTAESGTLEGTDASAQAARILRRLDQLTPVQRALLVVSYAPSSVPCACRRPCCSGHYPNRDWAAAVTLLTAHTAALFAGHAPNLKLRRALIANLLTHTAETQVALAQRYGVHRQTVASHTAILTTALIGTRRTGGEFDHAFARIDTLLHDAGIVADASVAEAA